MENETERKCRRVEVPVRVTLMMPMPASTGVDIDSLAEDATELVVHGQVSVDGVPVRVRIEAKDKSPTRKE